MMNPFVNPKKRDFLLPKGCKDLSDLLERTKWHIPSLAEVNATGVRAESKQGTVIHLEEHVRQFLASEELSRSLMIITRSPPEEECDITLFVEEAQILLDITALQGEQEAAVRSFFSRRGLEPLDDASGLALPFFPGARVYQILHYLLSKDVEQITPLIRDFLRDIHGVTAETELVFHLVHLAPEQDQ